MTCALRFVTGLAVLASSAGWGASPSVLTRSMRSEVERVGAALARAPYLMPVSVERRFVGVPFVIDERGGVSLGTPHAVWGQDPQVERHRAERLSRAPAFWIFVLDEGGRIAYWTPLNDSRTVRVETPADDDSGRIVAAAFRLKAARGIVHVPFLPGGVVCAVPGAPVRGRRSGGATGRSLGQDLP